MVKLLSIALVLVLLGVGVYVAFTKNVLPLKNVTTKVSQNSTPIEQVGTESTAQVSNQPVPVVTTSVEDDLTALEKDLNSLNAEDSDLSKDINNL